MKAWLRLLAVAFGFVLSAGPASACMTDYRTYFSYSRLQPRDGSVNLRVRVTEIRGRVVHAELDGPFARLSSDSNVRILLPSEPSAFACEELGPTEGRVFVAGRPVRGPSGTLTFEAVSSRPARFRRVQSLDRYDRYIVDPAYLSPEGRRHRESGQ